MSTQPDPLALLVDLALEQDVLGHLLRGAWALYEATGLRRDLFAKEAHRRVYAACQRLADTGGSIDLVTVAALLRADGTLEEVGVGYLSALIDGQVMPSDAHAIVVTRKLEELAAGRAAYYAAKALEQQLQTPGGVSDGAISAHLDTVQAILERRQTGQPAWLDAAAQWRAHVQDATLTQAYRVFLGLPALDARMDGIRAGEVCGLMGRPGIGKTVILCHVARAVSEVAGHVLFSLEMPAAQIAGRLKQMLFGIGRYDLEQRTRQGDLDEAQYLEIFHNLVIVDTPGLSVAEMSRRVRQIASGPLNHVPIRLVTIDHLGLIGGDRGLSTYDRVSTQAREIKELAKRLETAVLLAVQVNREAGGDGSRELGLGSARDSGVVEEAMDYLIGLRRLDRSLTLSPAERERYRDVIFTKVIKNRHGMPQPDESAYRFNPTGLALIEDGSLRPEVNDLERLAAPRGRR